MTQGTAGQERSDAGYRKHLEIHRSVLGDEIVPTLVEYIKSTNKSPSFDPD
jgi:hypothetical protein